MISKSALILRGLLLAAGLVRASPLPAAPQSSEVPLELYTDAQWPVEVPFGPGFGVSFLDYDRDGWVDLYVHFGGMLWRNEEGHTWSLAADLDVFLPPTRTRYGSSCADYDNDGLPDIATEPYSGDCFYLLKNLGQGSFVEVASDPTIVTGQPCGMYAETACWADVDDDRDLDLFVPAYPDFVFAGAGGNRFWENLGPTGPGGAYRLLLSTGSAGLENPPGVQRPEGAQFCDADRDGDLDLFSNHTLYQNRSRGRPAFEGLLEPRTGIGFADQLDEGALFFDYDMDGDQDLLVLYTGRRVRLWENRGDGTFFAHTARLEDPRLGSGTGSAAEDWDLDGDLDLTTSSAFRRNMLVETGEPFLRLVTPAVSAAFRSLAWADWDRDGDPDCVFMNQQQRNLLYRNLTYDRDTPGVENRSIRVRVLRDSEDVPAGLETEFGATVEVRVHGDSSGLVRRRFVASSHGYIQQSEYALTLALPPGPDPLAPAADVFFDLLVDFPGLAERGILRVDPGVNPALGSIHLAKLESREITVFRSGRVVLDGRESLPRPAFAQRLTTTGGGPPLASLAAPLPVPEPAPSTSWYSGIEILSSPAGRVRVEELILDGTLDSAVRCTQEGFNVALWDVTDPRAFRRTWQASLTTRPSNRRHFLPVSFELEPARRYRLVCRVTKLRPALLQSPGATESLRVVGGLSFQDADPCTGGRVADAGLDPARTCLWLRYRAPLVSRKALLNAR